MIMNFSTENLRNVFAEEGKFENFQGLLSDLREGNEIFEYDEEGNARKLNKKQANKAVQKVLMEVCGLNDEDLKSAKRVKRALAAHQAEIYEIIEEDVEFRVATGLQNDEWFMKFVENRNEALGDDTEFETKADKVLFIVAEISGDHHDLTMQSLPAGKRERLHTTKYGIKIGKDIDLVLLGRVDYTELVDRISESFVYDIRTKCFTAMYGAASKLPVDSRFKKTGALVKGTWDELLEDVATANQSDIYIVGTKMALKKLTALADVDWVSEGQKADVAAMGRLGSYEGTTMVEIPQRFKLNDVSEKLYSNDILFVFANTEDKFIKFVDKGETEIVERTEKAETADDFRTYEVQREYGVGVMLGQYFGVYEVETA